MKEKAEEHKIRRKQNKLKGEKLLRTCVLCFRVFNDKRGCLRHVCNSHSKNKNSANKSATKPELVCSLCSKVFTHIKSFERHNREHSENSTESFECEHCDKKYTRKDNLLKHEQRIHGFYKIDFERAASFSSINNMFKCPLCLASFGEEKERFFAHIASKVCHKDPNYKHDTDITEDLRFKCQLCEKSYSNKDSLKRHARWKHDKNIKKFECNSCKMTFNYESSLKRHIKKSHANE